MSQSVSVVDKASLNDIQTNLEWGWNPVLHRVKTERVTNGIDSL